MLDLVTVSLSNESFKPEGASILIPKGTSSQLINAQKVKMMMPGPLMEIHLFLLFFILFLLMSSSSASPSNNDVSFNFPSFTSPTIRNLTLFGDAYLRSGLVGLTRETLMPCSGSGSIIYTDPIAFRDPESNTTASFSTTFTFSITNAHPPSSGDGLTFFLSPDSKTLGSPGPFLGLVNSTHRNIKTRFVAVEFDTRMDPRFSDPSDNHVGLDINGLNSVKTTDLMYQGIDLKSGDSITAWIDYMNDLGMLLVFLSYSSILKPERPVLTVNIDLSDHLDGLMYPGFSASAQASSELHLIESWSFQTFGFLPARPGSHPHSVSDSSVIMRPPVSVLATKSSSHRKNLRSGLGVAAPAVFCAALIVFGYMSIRKWRDIKIEQSFKAELATVPREFSYKELKNATGGFHSSRIVGTGAFGTVYKATLSSETMAAVKRSKHSYEGKSEFLAELSIIACLRHKNLVQLQGWCVEKGELLLVFDFMPNGSLDKILYRDSEAETLLNWSRRQNIAVGLAAILAYLHQECENQVIHRDVKTSNIMLDSGFNARLGDFGLARIMARGDSPVSTLTAGTMGYLAPEYLQYGKVNEKTDVFSYGVVVLEVACGRRPIEREFGNPNHKMVNLVDWVWGLHSEGRIIEAADKRLKGEFREDEMYRMLLLGLSCANPDSDSRPNMRKVVQALVNEKEPNRVPKAKPTLSFTTGLPMALEEIISDGEEKEELIGHCVPLTVMSDSI